jgi:hypothetical protein
MTAMMISLPCISLYFGDRIKAGKDVAKPAGAIVVQGNNGKVYIPREDQAEFRRLEQAVSEGRKALKRDPNNKQLQDGLSTAERQLNTFLG